MGKLQQVAMLAALAGAITADQAPVRAWSSIPAKPGKLKTGTRKALREKRKAQRQNRRKSKR